MGDALHKQWRRVRSKGDMQLRHAATWYILSFDIVLPANDFGFQPFR